MDRVRRSRSCHSPYGEKDKEYVADGLTEDIITALARFRWFRVVGRSSAFAYKGATVNARQTANELGASYCLQGSVRHAENRLRISVQLIDATDDHHVWADRYDVEMADVFAIQDEIAERVVGAIEPELLRSVSYLAIAPHTGNMTAWDLVRQGMWHFHKVTKEGHHSARALFRRACGIDPDLPESHIWLGRVSAGIIAYGWSAEPDADGREGTDAATRALALDPRDPYAHYAFAIVSAYAGSASAAACAAQTAIGLNPSFTLGHLVLGMSRLFDGEPQRAIVPLAHGLRLNPNDPQNLVWFNLLAYAQLLAGEPGNALESANRALTVRPVFRPTFEVLACCAVALGQLDDARIWAARVKSLDGPASHFIAPLRRNHADCDAQIARMLNWQARS